MNRDVTRTEKDLLREQIREELAAFLKAGGKVQVIPFGETGGTWKGGILILKKRRRKS